MQQPDLTARLGYNGNRPVARGKTSKVPARRVSELLKAPLLFAPWLPERMLRYCAGLGEQNPTHAKRKIH